MVAVAYRRGADALQVRTGARLGHGDGADHLARHHARQPALLQLLRAVVDDVVDDDVGLERDAGGRARVAQLLADHGVEPIVKAQAAVFRRDLRAQDPGFARRQPEVAINDAFLFPAVEVGIERLVIEFPHLVAEQVEVLVIDGAGVGLDHGARTNRCSPTGGGSRWRRPGGSRRGAAGCRFLFRRWWPALWEKRPAVWRWP